MKKRGIAITLLIIIFIILIVISSIWVYSNIIDFEGSLKWDRKVITKIINKKYPSYKISDLKLKYVDFYSSVRNVDEELFPDRATISDVYIYDKNNNDILRVTLNKYYIISWKIVSVTPISGSSVPDNEFYLYTTGYDTTCMWDDSYIEKNKKVFYSDHCFMLYKTSGGKVYKYDLENDTWGITETSYSTLKNFLYNKISYEESEKIINYLKKSQNN